MKQKLDSFMQISFEGTCLKQSRSSFTDLTFGIGPVGAALAREEFSEEKLSEGLGLLKELPEEVLLHILSFLDGRDVLRSRTVSRAWLALTYDEPVLWKTICMREKLDPAHRPPGHPYSWQWLYKATHNELRDPQGNQTTDVGYYVSDNSTHYEGDWVNGKRHGFGVSYQRDRFKYVGQWENDKKEGLGRQVWEDGSRYEGEWRGGTKHGHGTYYWQDGERYVGEWREDEEDGIGVYEWATGDRYEGEWSKGCKHGKGVHTWGEGPWRGDRYEGEWRNDMQDGHGRYTWNDGRVYEGGWRQHRRHGYGMHLFSDGARYEGQWQDGRRHGHGCMVWADGSRYEGDWINDDPLAPPAALRLASSSSSSSSPSASPARTMMWAQFFQRSKEEQRQITREWRANMAIAAHARKRNPAFS